MQPIKIVDLFAGPGGLGEGFSAFRDGDAHPFTIAVSAEKDKYAHSTLRLRAYWRLLKRHGRSPDALYSYYQGKAPVPWSPAGKDLWEMAGEEALLLELGKSDQNRRLYEKIDQHIAKNEPWVLIGGPPCQAYSVVGRVRTGAENQNDPRHYLYKEYLKVIRRFHPTIFVMENVRGMLSCQVGARRIIHRILHDLAGRGGNASNGPHPGYVIHSLVTDTRYQSGMKVSDIDLQDFVVRSEQFGIPQARHRVVLVGVREDVGDDLPRLSPSERTTVEDAIGDMPKLRSGISRQEDSSENWKACVTRLYAELAGSGKKAGDSHFADNLLDVRATIQGRNLTRGARWMVGEYAPAPAKASDLHEWLRDDALGGWLNHETRAHMVEDLRRYAYASTYACIYARSPVGPEEFDFPGLAPNHANWGSGKFSDRFKVQLDSRPSSTITSHIAKDGHAFIHPDPTQCRSLTVREAARLQTFPDNYFFEGPRTEQYIQVGNAVPPLLARQMAQCIWQIMKNVRRF